MKKYIERKGKTSMALSDVDLMQRFIEGDEDAFVTIVQRYESLLLGIAHQMLFDHDLAQDACQHTWLKLFLHKPHGGVSLKNWLIAVVSHRCLDEKRHQRKAPLLFSSRELANTGEDVPSVIDLFPDTHPTPEQLIEGNEDSTYILSALKQLPEKYRVVFQLSVFGGYSLKEISQHVDQKENTVKTQVARARHRLRQILDQQRTNAT
jgi:RNA polymerase sigma factor (sigma-70 family)